MYQSRQTAYRETEVLSSSPERLIPLMYEKLLVSLKRGALCIERGDIEGKYESLGRAQDIVHELLGSLDYEQGGDIARRLASLYVFWAKEVSEASRRLQPARISKVAEMVSDLHESWVEAVRSVERGGSEPGAAGSPD